MVAAAAARSSSSPADAPTPPETGDEPGKKMAEAIGRSQEAGAAGAPPVGQPANDSSASGQGARKPEPSASGSSPAAPQPAGPGASPAGQPAPDPSAPDSGQDAGPAGQAPADPSTSGLTEGVQTTADTLKDPTAQIRELNSDGDQAVISMTAEVKGQVPLARIPLGVGGKGQYGYDITVAQVGDKPAAGQPGAQPTYDVTFDKNLLAGVTVEPAVPGIDPAGELNLTSADTVTMNFKTPEDAGRAVQTLERLAGAETIRDVGHAVTPGLSNPAANPVPEGDGSLSGPSITDPVANQVAPSEQDMKFLRDNITSYTTTLGVQERGKAAVKFANLGIEPRLDGNQQISRTVELPRDGQPGRLTYTLSGDVQASTKEKLTLGKQQLDQLEIGYTPQNIVDHGNVRGEVSVSWDLPAGGTDPSVSGRPVPEADALSGEGLGAPDEVKAKFSFEGQSQPLTDLSRTDFERGSLEVSVKNPAQHAGPVLNKFFEGDLRGAFTGMGEDFSVTATREQVRRDGLEQQHELGFEVADVGEAKVSLIGEVGVDDVSNRRTKTFTGEDIAGRANATPPEPTPPVGEPAPTETPGQLVVTPRDGLNVRDKPSLDGAELSAFQHGTFVQPTGARQADGTGREWVEVAGTDVNDKPVQGWVDGQYLQSHPKGAMDESGRINPDLEQQGYREHVVKPGENVWDIARRDGVNFRDTLDLNSEHLINPGMIFPGDKVYIPGTANPPAPPPAEPVEPTKPETPSGSGGPGASGSGPLGSGSSGSGPSESGSGAPGPSGSNPPPSGSGPSQPPAQPQAPSQSGGAPAPGEPTPPASESGQPPQQGPASGSEDPSASGGPAAPTEPAAPPAGPTAPQPGAERTDAQGRTLDDVVRDYQVPFDDRPRETWSPGGLGFIPGVPEKELTAGEADVLDSIMPNIGKVQAMNNAYETANKTPFQPGENVSQMSRTQQNDGHQDAFRHAYWNALMGKNAGDSEANRFATAHEEGTKDNPAAREAMDLYNNEQGRRIARENPGASDEELAGLVRDSINRGEMVVIDKNGELAWSDQVQYGQHGLVPAGAAPGEANGPLIDKSSS